jgi:hypothetical protein
MRATLILADYADLSNGKLGILGGGITWFYAHSAIPLSVAVLIDADARDAGVKHAVKLRIVNAGGEEVGYTGEDGKAYRFEIDDEISWAKPTSAVDNDLDHVWVGRWFGINLDPGLHRFEFLVNDKVIGAQSMEVRPQPQ